MSEKSTTLFLIYTKTACNLNSFESVDKVQETLHEVYFFNSKSLSFGVKAF